MTAAQRLNAARHVIMAVSGWPSTHHRTMAEVLELEELEELARHHRLATVMQAARLRHLRARAHFGALACGIVR